MPLCRAWRHSAAHAKTVLAIQLWKTLQIRGLLWEIGKTLVMFRDLYLL